MTGGQAVRAVVAIAAVLLTGVLAALVKAPDSKSSTCPSGYIQSDVVVLTHVADTTILTCVSERK